MNKVFSSVVVCTKDRSQDIQQFLESLIRQTRKPDELLIIDASEHEKEIASSVNNIVLDYVGSVKYFRTKPSLAQQRNFSLSKLDARCNVVSFFDDDVVLDKDYLKAVIDIFEDSKNIDVAGVTGKIKNSRDVTMKAIKKFFLLYSHAKGVILSSGFNIRNLDNLTEKVFIEWMPGGMSSYRRDIFREFSFDEQYSRNGAGREDIDFSYRVSRRHRLLFTPDAVLEHKESEVSRVSERQLGRIQVDERYYFVRKNMNRLVNEIAFFWSIFGIMIINAAMSILKPGVSAKRRQRLKGNILGLFRVLFKTGR